LDSTNVIPAPEVAVLTNMGLEHTQELGNTLTLIATEKAGILKPGCSAVLYRQSREAEQVVENQCQALSIPLTVTAPDTLEVLSSDQAGQTFRYRGHGPFHISLLGSYQLQNAATAIETIWALRQRGWNIPDPALEQGLQAAVWLGRMELARRKPDVLLDGGHNPQCMEALSGSLARLYPGKKIWFLTGVLADKNYPAMYQTLLPLARGFVTITPDSPRAMTAAALADYLQSLSVPATPCASAQEGLEQVLSLAQPEDVVCVCGSLYMIGAVRHLLGLC
jgi:dihydrofolate synthase/folylpolyglutamate synthase